MTETRRFDRFVLFAEMRTGSNLLEETLNAVPGLCCYGEAFNPHFVGHKDCADMLGVSLTVRDRDPRALLAAMDSPGGALPGFRFFHDHDPRVLDIVLADPRTAKIILTRNPLESYVSLKIAGRTGQWRLTDLRHARKAEMHFDAREFAAHLDAVQGFQSQLLRALQISGQTAFHIGYEDLGDLQVLNGLLRFLGLTARLGAVPSRIKKQNPEPLKQKVANYSEMTKALAALDPFGLSSVPSFEPRRGPAVPGYVAAPQSPLLFLPVRGGPVVQVEAWLAALDGADPGTLLREFTQKTLQDWKGAHPGHRSFAVISHPLTRAHRVFCTHILGTGPESFPKIRRSLRQSYGVPLPEEDPGAGDDATAHRAAFLGFLRFLKGNLGGQTGLRVDPSWASQSSVLQGMAAVALPDRLIRAERLAEDLADLAELVGQPAPALPEDDVAVPVPLTEIYDDEIETAARNAYPRDYLAFGYGDWRA